MLTTIEPVVLFIYPGLKVTEQAVAVAVVNVVVASDPADVLSDPILT